MLDAKIMHRGRVEVIEDRKGKASFGRSMMKGKRVQRKIQYISRKKTLKINKHTTCLPILFYSPLRKIL